MISRRDLLKTLSLLFAGLSTNKGVQAFSSPAPEEDLTQYVNPMIGTGGHGHTYPGATVPFGMVQLSPDNGVNGWDWCSGYHYSSNEIVGFSHTHLSGTGIGDMMDICFMPFITSDSSTTFIASKFLHENETASAGYYSVTLQDSKIKAELTTTKRAGFHRYTFPQVSGNEKTSLLINLTRSFNWDSTTDFSIESQGKTIKGFRKSTGWAKNQEIYFYAEFSHFHNTNTDNIFLFDFQTEGKPLLVKVGISATSTEAAKKNLEMEIPHWDFERTKNEAKEAWNRELKKVKLKTENRKLKTVFYTALYHAYLAPTLFNDVDGSYRGADKKVHKAVFDNYTTFSLWDTFRAAHPLYTIFQPERVDAMVKSMMAFYREHGLLPVWSLMANETNTMIGYHSIPVIVDAIQKGLTKIDEREAFEAMKKSAFNRDRGLQYYRMPEPTTLENLYKTLERDSIKPIETQKPFEFPKNFVAGYAKRISGNTIGYHSAHANVNEALIARTMKDKNVIEWETAPIPKIVKDIKTSTVEEKKEPNAGSADVHIRFIEANAINENSIITKGNFKDNFAGVRASRSGGLESPRSQPIISFVWLAGIDVDQSGRRYDLYVNNEKWFEFHNPKEASQKSFQVKAANGATLSFYTTHIDRFGDFFGYMTLTAPIEILKTDTLRLKVVGADENDDDWFMTFEHSLGNKMTVSNVYALANIQVKTDGEIDKTSTSEVVRLDIEHVDLPCKARIEIEAQVVATDMGFKVNVVDIPMDLNIGLNTFFLPLPFQATIRRPDKVKLTYPNSRELTQTFTLRPVKPFNYIPAELENESVSKTLEYAYDDWCIAQMAKRLNSQDDHKLFTERSLFYKNLFDKETGFMRGKLSDGSWKTPFSPKFSSHRQDEYTEGNAWQYSWFVPHDVEGMIQLFGGREAFIKKLDQLFTESSVIEGTSASPDISGLIGQYAHGNEPSHHIAYLYALAGAHHKTENIVRQITSTLYDDTPEGLCGNEDCGQMSAWYIFSALGFYPVNPASSLYVLGTPHFEKVEIDVGKGKTFTVIAKGLSEANKYVQSVSLNGKTLREPFIKHSDIMNGGTLAFEMGSKSVPSAVVVG